MQNIFNVSNNADGKIFIQNTSSIDDAGNAATFGRPSSGPIVKQEPDVDPASYPEPAEPVESARPKLIPKTRHPQPKRGQPTDDELMQSLRQVGEDSQPGASICWEGVLLGMPHHHRLKCGHDIVTKEIVRCGDNCGLSSYIEAKPSGSRFACPDRTCVAKDPFAKKGRSIGGRQGRLTYVYGIHEEQDKARNAKKAMATSTKMGGLLIAMDMNRSSTVPSQREVKEQEARRKANVQDKINDHHLKRLAEGMDFEDPDVRRANAKRARMEKEKVISDPLLGPDPEAYKDEPRQQAIGSWKDRFAPDLELAADVEDDAEMGGISGGDYPEEEEEIVPQDGAGRLAEDPDDDEPQKLYCTCQQPEDQYMMECQACTKLFHPGCADKGQKSKLTYAYSGHSRTKAWKDDRKHFRDKKQDEFVCGDCDIRQLQYATSKPSILAKLASETRARQASIKADVVEYNSQGAVENRKTTEATAASSRPQRRKFQPSFNTEKVKDSIDPLNKRKRKPAQRKAELSARTGIRMTATYMYAVDENTGQTVPVDEDSPTWSTCDNPECNRAIKGDYYRCTNCDDPGCDYCKECFEAINTTMCGHALAAFRKVKMPESTKS